MEYLPIHLGHCFLVDVGQYSSTFLFASVDDKTLGVEEPSDRSCGEDPKQLTQLTQLDADGFFPSKCPYTY